jgi:hypothetical protein
MYILPSYSCTLTSPTRMRHVAGAKSAWSVIRVRRLGRFISISHLLGQD